jgi:MHS family proline/betaine transporter-like MFS transporter
VSTNSHHEPGLQRERGPTKKAVVAGSVGVALENMDNGIYGFLAATLAALFFPPNAPENVALLATFAAFWGGLIARPIGGILWGSLGDRIGRRTTLVLVITMMAGATMAIGLLPTYAQIGAWASVLLFTFRLLQGFAQGGDFGNAASFLVEYAPASKRGLYGSSLHTALLTGFVVLSGAMALLTSFVSEEALNAWAWRVPFLLGGLVGLFGLWVRMSVDESPQFEELQETGEVRSSPLRDSLRYHLKPTLKVLAVYSHWVIIAISLSGYTVAYVTTQTNLELSQALIANTIAFAVGVPIIPLLGALSDRIGRRPTMIASCVVTLLIAFPVYLLMLQGTFLAFLAAQGLLMIPYSLTAGPFSAAMVEMFPASVRVSSLTTGSNLAIAVFGGATPFVSTFLIGQLGTSLAPGIWLTVAAAIAVLVLLFGVKETARGPLKR